MRISIKFFVFGFHVLCRHGAAAASPAWTLLKSEDKAVKVVVAVRAEQHVQRVPGAPDWRGQPVPAEPSNHRRAQAVAVAHLYVIVATAVVRLKTKERETAAKQKTDCRRLFFLISLSPFNCLICAQDGAIIGMFSFSRFSSRFQN